MKHAEIRKNRKETILNAAVKCFTEYGYHKASMDMIAEAAEITKRGLYYHFKSKDNLFIEIFKSRGEKYFEILNRKGLSTAGPEQKLRQYIEKGIGILKEDELFMRFLVEFVSIGVRNQKVKKVITGHYNESIQRIKKLLEEGIKSGELKPHDAEKVSRTIYFVGLGKFFAQCSFDTEVELFEQHMFDVEQIINGLKNK